MIGPQLFACPNRRCNRVVSLLLEIEVTIGLDWFDPAYRCAQCIAQLELEAAADPLSHVRMTGRSLPPRPPRQ